MKSLFKSERYCQTVAFFESLLNLPIKNYEVGNNDRSYFIKRLDFFLNLLGNPHQGFKYIHITGTAGKGTTVNLIHEILNKAGLKVGSYFSPHTTTSIERIKVNDLYISSSDFVKIIDDLKPILAKCALTSPYGHPSYFETFLAIAFLYFQQQKCDYVVLEAGLGGQYDATNIIERPLMTIITNINYDHQEILGNTLTKIANDKSGIIKNGSIFLTTEHRPKLLKLLEKKAQGKGAEFHSYQVQPTERNVFLAKKASEFLKINNQKIIRGIKSARLPCRFEIIQKKPLIILDGSHNPTKMAMVARNLQQLKFKRLIVIIGMAEDKDQQKTLEKIVPLADDLIITRFLNPYRKSADIKGLYQISKELTRKRLNTIRLFLDPWQALSYGQEIQKADDCLLITGSFFLTGELRTRWVPEKYILKHRKSF